MPVEAVQDSNYYISGDESYDPNKNDNSDNDLLIRFINGSSNNSGLIKLVECKIGNLSGNSQQTCNPANFKSYTVTVADLDDDVKRGNLFSFLNDLSKEISKKQRGSSGFAGIGGPAKVFTPNSARYNPTDNLANVGNSTYGDEGQSEQERRKTQEEAYRKAAFDQYDYERQLGGKKKSKRRGGNELISVGQILPSGNSIIANVSNTNNLMQTPNPYQQAAAISIPQSNPSLTSAMQPFTGTAITANLGNSIEKSLNPPLFGGSKKKYNKKK